MVEKTRKTRPWVENLAAAPRARERVRPRARRPKQTSSIGPGKTPWRVFTGAAQGMLRHEKCSKKRKRTSGATSNGRSTARAICLVWWPIKGQTTGMMSDLKSQKPEQKKKTPSHRENKKPPYSCNKVPRLVQMGNKNDLLRGTWESKQV